MAASFKDWWEDHGYLYEPDDPICELSEAAWNAAEKKFTSTNTGSPKLPTLEETKESVKEWLDCKPEFMPMPSPAEIVKITHDYICRQHRAGA